MRSIFRWTKRITAIIAAVAVILLALRVYDAERGLPLEPWHKFSPRELSGKALDRADWQSYLAAENKAFDAVRAEFTEKLGAKDRVPVNRYFEGSPVYPPRLPNDWNRSYVLSRRDRPPALPCSCMG